MVEQILRSISKSISQVGQETGQFRKAADGQNKSIGNFIKDVSKMFSSQNKQQASINTSLDDIQYNSQQTNSKVSQSNDLIQESISIQTQMLSELRSVSKGIGSLIEGLGLGGFGGGGGTGSKIASALLAGGIGATAGALGGAGMNFLSQQSGLEITNFIGSGGDANSGAGSSQNAASAVNFFKSKGWSDTHAAGIVGNLQAESGKDLNPSSVGDDGSAYGIAQWRNDRQTNFSKFFGKRIQDSSFEEQLKFVQWELENTHADAAEKIKQAKTASEAAALVDKYYEISSGIHTQKRMDNAEALMPEQTPEGDESSAPANTLMQKSGVMGDTRSGVSELQQRLAGVRKLPLSSRLRSVLDQAAAAAGVEVVVYSGGQSPKGSGGPRTGTTRHDNGNAADLYLMKDGKKLSDTNPEDRAVMAKFVSSAVSAGATGVGAGHGYMGASNIHVGFGKQATWGGAPWIQSAASGIFNNKDLSAESGVFGGGGASSAGFTPTGNEGYDQYMSQLGGLGGLGSAAAMLTQAGTSLLTGMSGLSFDNIASVFNNTGSESSTNSEIEDKEESPNIENDSNTSSKAANLTPQPSVDNRSTLIDNNASQTQIASQMPSVPVSDKTQQGDVQSGQSGYTTTAGNMSLNGSKDTTLPDWYRSLFGVGGGRVVPDGEFYQTLA